jgi:hypothetical protein
MISQRDAILLETVNTLKAQFDSMTEEVGTTRYLHNRVQFANRCMVDRLGKASRYRPVTASNDCYWALGFIAVRDCGCPSCQATDASKEQHRTAGQAR